MKALILDNRKKRGIPAIEEEEGDDSDPASLEDEVGEQAATEEDVLGFGGRHLPSRPPEEGLSCYPHGPDDQPAATTTTSTSRGMDTSSLDHLPEGGSLGAVRNAASASAPVLAVALEPALDRSSQESQPVTAPSLDQQEDLEHLDHLPEEGGSLGAVGNAAHTQIPAPALA